MPSPRSSRNWPPGLAIWAHGAGPGQRRVPDTDRREALPLQPQAAVDAIRFFMGPIPAVLLLLAIVFAWRFNITRQSHQAMVRS